MSFPSICVLMSTYNGEEYVFDQITSVLAQEGNFSLTCLVRDDGSTDGTVRILKRIADEYSPRVSLLIGNNIGLNNSFLELLEHVEPNDYYAFCDQDDIWLPHKISRAISSIGSNDSSKPLLYASRSIVCDKNLVPLGLTRKASKPIVIENALIQNVCPGHTQVFNEALRSIVLEKTTERNNIYYYDSWLACFAALYGEVLFDSVPQVLYRQHEKNRLGSGTGSVGRGLRSLQRVKDARLYLRQVTSFFEANMDEIDRVSNLSSFCRMVGTPVSVERLKVVMLSPVFRQSWWETLLIKCLFSITQPPVSANHR